MSKRTPGIYKQTNRDGTVVYKAWVEAGRSATGKRLQETGTFATLREAEQWRRSNGAARDNGLPVRQTAETVDVYLRRWLEGLDLGEGTVSDYRMQVERRIVPTLGRCKVVSLTPADLDALYRQLERAGGRGGKPLSKRSVRLVAFVLSKSLSDGVRQGVLAQNVAKRATPPKPKRPEMKCWTRSELRAFLDHVAGDSLYPAWMLYALTGMRRGEVLGLRWADVDLDRAQLSVRQTVVLSNGRVRVGKPKTLRSTRTVPLPGEVVTALRAHRARQLEERLASGGAYTDLGLVFARPDGSALNPDTVSQQFLDQAAAAGLRRIRMHDLRHTFATVALEAGVALWAVSDILGHSSISITADVYRHSLPAKQAEATALVAGLVFGR